MTDIILGIDLCNDYTQISWYNNQTNQPESIAIGADSNSFRIPTLLVSRRNTKNWLIGEEALLFANDNRGDKDICVIKDLLRYAEESKVVPVFDTSYSVASLLEKFFRRILTEVKNQLGDANIKGVTVTLARHNTKVEEVVKRAFAMLGIESDRMNIVTHLTSFMYYTVCQSSDIWINDVGLFDFEPEGLVFYRLSFGRKMIPVIVTASRQELKDRLSNEELESLTPHELAYRFGELSGQLLYRQIISAIYVTGNEAADDWLGEPLKAMCAGRRVFRGQNLYTKGACYRANILYNTCKDGYVMISDEMLVNDIGIRAYRDGSYEEIRLANAGECWKDVDSEVYVIMDNTDELDLLVRNVFKKDSVCAIISLPAIGDVSGKDCRVRLNLRFLDRDTAVITIRDDGFGELRKSSRRIWEQILKL